MTREKGDVRLNTKMLLNILRSATVSILNLYVPSDLYDTYVHEDIAYVQIWIV